MNSRLENIIDHCKADYIFFFNPISLMGYKNNVCTIKVYYVNRMCQCNIYNGGFETQIKGQEFGIF